jgi:hypothetical protein
MRTKYVASILTLLLLASVFIFGLTVNKASAQGTTISIPSVSETPSAYPGTFTVPVQISNVNNLFGFDIKITWDNTLFTFLSLDNTSLYTVWTNGFFEPLTAVAPYTNVQSGAGYVRYAALATGGSGYTGVGPTTLFTITFTIVKAGNFQYTTTLHFDTVKLSDNNANAITATPIDGPYTMSATTPDLEFKYSGPGSSTIVWGTTFQIQVYATAVTDLDGYNLVITYDNSILKLTSVDWTGDVLGGTHPGANYTESPPGTINVIESGNGVWTGTEGLLFTLNFQVQFTGADPTHIWRTNNEGPLNTLITCNGATLTFVEGTITTGGINMPANQNIVVNLIKGDVDCTGLPVTVLDLRTVAYYYDKTNTTDPDWYTFTYKYDIKADGTIDIFDLVEIAASIG